MSWQTINHIVGLAMVDTEFASELLAHPLSTIQEFGFDLTEQERAALQNIKASSLVELSQLLTEKLADDKAL